MREPTPGKIVNNRVVNNREPAMQNVDGFRFGVLFGFTLGFLTCLGIALAIAVIRGLGH